MTRVIDICIVILGHTVRSYNVSRVTVTMSKSYTYMYHV